VAEAVVCVVSPAGRATGLVGDLGLGFTKPAGEAWSTGGFLDAPDELDSAVLAAFLAPPTAFGVAVFSGCVAFFSGVLMGILGVVGVFSLVGDLAEGLIDALAVEMADGLEMVLPEPDLGASFAAALALSAGALPFRP
jgi:hypothetical protein